MLPILLRFWQANVRHTLPENQLRSLAQSQFRFASEEKVKRKVALFNIFLTSSCVAVMDKPRITTRSTQTNYISISSLDFQLTPNEHGN
mmetsp:Transcript_54679/g.81186  ORF Transcript_54679/g.81186 Transcript_54679/m.81186 type:complete len:89 (-) Transcript_54679:356-622(-)